MNAAPEPWPESAGTLGEHLAREARRLAARRQPAVPWLRLLGHVLERVAALPVPAGERFRRAEALGYALELGPRLDDLRWHVPVGEATPAAAEAEPERQPIAPTVRAQLQTIVGPETEIARVQTGAAADAMAREHRAEAVTVGRDVYFRHGFFRPQADEGFALLAHEAAHVVRGLRPDAAWRRATQSGVREEEQEAGSREHAALWQRRAVGPSPTVPRDPAPSAGEMTSRGAAPAAAQRPMAAATDRAVSDASAAPAAAPDFEELRQTLYRDLMRQLRADFERGG